MRSSSRHAALALAASGMLLAAVPAFGQAANPDAWTREQIEKERTSIVLNSLKLTAEESAALRPVYTEFRAAMDRYDQLIGGIILDFGKNYASLTDAKAGELMDKWLATEKGRLDNRADYFNRFREVLPAKKVLRLAQMENKLDAVVRMDMARAVPVAR